MQIYFSTNMSLCLQKYAVAAQVFFVFLFFGRGTKGEIRWGGIILKNMPKMAAFEMFLFLFCFIVFCFVLLCFCFCFCFFLTGKVQLPRSPSWDRLCKDFTIKAALKKYPTYSNTEQNLMFCQSSSKIGMSLGTCFVKRENNIPSNKFQDHTSKICSKWWFSIFSGGNHSRTH